MNVVTARQFGIQKNLCQCHHGDNPLYLAIELRSSNARLTFTQNYGAQRFKVDQIGFTLRAEDSGFPWMQWRKVFTNTCIRG